MIRKMFSRGLLVFLLMFSYSAVAQASSDPVNLAPSGEWHTYMTFDGIKVEYRVAPCQSELLKNHMNCWFRFSNETGEKRQLQWTLKWFRDGACYNCTRLDNPEYTHMIELEAGQTIAADETTMNNDAFYVFNYFIVKSPGMTDTELTGFEFINAEVTAITE